MKKILNRIIFKRLKSHLKHYTVQEKGYIDTTDIYENIVWIEYRLFDILSLWKKVVFKEDVPMFAVINRATLGSSYWSSSKPWLIDMADGMLLKCIIKI